MTTKRWVPPARIRERVPTSNSFKRFTFLSVMVMAVDLNGCQTPAQGNGKVGAAIPYLVTGTVTTAAGVPLAGAEVFADNTLVYDMNVTALTDAAGKYRITLPHDPLGPWNIGGYVNIDYRGVSHRLRLHPLLDQAVLAAEGGVRNLEWRLTGEDPGGDQFYGEEAWVYEYEFGSSLLIEDAELTFTPLEPLIDGSTIEPLVRRPDGSKIADVPLGYYRVSARYLPAGETPSDLLINLRYEEPLAASVDAAFTYKELLGTVMEFDVGRSSE